MTRYRSGLGVALSVALGAMLGLAPPASARKPIISYVDQQAHFQLYDAEAGANVSPPPPVPVPEGKASQLGWATSANGRYIVFNDAEGKLHLLDRSSNQEVPLPNIVVAKAARQLDRQRHRAGRLRQEQQPAHLCFDSSTGQYVDVGLGDATPSEPTNVLRQPRFSGDGNFMVNTCFDNAETACFTTGDSDSDVFMQDLATKEQVPEFPDEPKGESVDEEHPCINGDGTLIGVERKPEKLSKSKDIFLFQRSGTKFSKLETPKSERPRKRRPLLRAQPPTVPTSRSSEKKTSQPGIQALRTVLGKLCQTARTAL